MTIVILIITVDNLEKGHYTTKHILVLEMNRVMYF